jgi:hypothetical protein
MVGYRSPTYSGDPDKGPIPEGNYYISTTDGDIAKTVVFRQGRNVYEGLAPGNGIQIVEDPYFVDAWGRLRARITPNGANTKGRSNFYLHSSNKGYTHGCIETKGSEQIFTDLRHYRSKKIPLIVRY